MISEDFNENEILGRIKPTYIDKLVPIRARIGRYAKYRYFSSRQFITPPLKGLDCREEHIKRVADALGFTYRLVSDQEWGEAFQL